jgi:ribosomal protein S12 methylthiotransferase accessory factor
LIVSTSARVDVDTVRGPARALVDTIKDAGLELFVRTAKNVFGMPYFFAIINDPDACAPHLLNGGFGCHPHRSVAFVRAVSEAAQSRLAYIHGGRDDLARVYDRMRGWGRQKKAAFVANVTKMASAGESIAMDDVDDHSKAATTVEKCEALLLDRLAANGMPRAYRVRFSRDDDELQVVRMIVPRLEMYDETISRVGQRLRDHARASA